MLITLNHLKSSLQAVKTYINNVLPKKVSDLVDDSGHYTKPSGGIPASDLADGVVPDLTEYVKNTDYASITDAGIVKIASGGGITITNNHEIKTTPATNNQVKVGTENSRQITPYLQGQSAFYGLAKAAGDSTQSASANAVGTYTDEAKIAIQKMLGIYEAPWELIHEDTFTNETEEDYIINTDANGEPFELTDIALLIKIPANSNTIITGYGQINFYFNNTSSYLAALLYNFTGPKATAYFGNVYIVKQNNANLFAFTRYTESGSLSALNIRNDFGYVFNSRVFNKIILKKVTGTLYYRLYGKRNWQ